MSGYVTGLVVGLFIALVIVVFTFIRYDSSEISEAEYVMAQQLAEDHTSVRQYYDDLMDDNKITNQGLRALIRKWERANIEVKYGTEAE